MNKISFLIIMMIILVACEKNDEPSNSDYSYGKFITNDSIQLIKIKLNDVVLLEFDYDSVNRLSRLNFYNSDSIVHYETYLYNSNDQIIERKYGSITEYFVYDIELLVEKFSINENNSSWRPKTCYYYDSHNRINKADVYFNNDLTGSIEFEYDSKGNTISRREYSEYDNETILSSEFKFEYDDKTNPIQLIYFSPIDIIQKNNIIYSYFYSIMMSSLPPEYNATYIYDDQGFPLKETRIYTGASSAMAPQIYTYIYNE